MSSSSRDRSATPTLFSVCVFLTNTLSLPVPPSPRDWQIVLCLWLIKFCTACSRRCWTMPLPLQCREIFKLCVPVTKLGLWYCFPLSCHKSTVKMNEDGAASTACHLQSQSQYVGASNPPRPSLQPMAKMRHTYSVIANKNKKAKRQWSMTLKTLAN